MKIWTLALTLVLFVAPLPGIAGTVETHPEEGVTLYRTDDMVRGLVVLEWTIALKEGDRPAGLPYAVLAVRRVKGNPYFVFGVIAVSDRLRYDHTTDMVVLLDGKTRVSPKLFKRENDPNGGMWTVQGQGTFSPATLRKFKKAKTLAFAIGPDTFEVSAANLAKLKRALKAPWIAGAK